MPDAIRGRLIEKLKDSLKESIDKDVSAELIPNDENEAEQYLLLGRQDAIIANMSLLMAIRQMFRQYEPVVGVPYQQFVESNFTPLIIQIHWRINKIPPFEPESLIKELRQAGTLTRATPPRPYCNLVIEDRSRITWENVKAAAGGTTGYKYGRFWAAANVGNREGSKVGKGGVVKVYAESETEAVTRLEALLNLSGQTVWTISTGEERLDKGVRATNIKYRKPECRIYPAFFTIFNYYLVADLASNQDGLNAGNATLQGRVTALGNMVRSGQKIYLWQSQAPRDIQVRINDAMRRADEV